MKQLIDPALKGKELFSFLVENKAQLIAQKKAIIKHTEPVFTDPGYLVTKEGVLVKADSPVVDESATSCMVKVVANTAWWCDSQMDVLIPDNAKRSIKERKGMIPHLHDHIHRIDAEVGDVKNIYYEDITLSSLGLKNRLGSTQALIFETNILKSYNERVFNKYRAKKINQHSIGLQYVKLDLAINDEDSLKEKEFWDKYIQNVINKEFVEERGFFWVVSEIKLLENSCVLFGSNELTPTLDVKGDTTDQPPVGTEEDQPSDSPFDLAKAIKETKIFI